MQGEKPSELELRGMVSALGLMLGLGLRLGLVLGLGIGEVDLKRTASPLGLLDGKTNPTGPNPNPNPSPNPTGPNPKVSRVDSNCFGVIDQENRVVSQALTLTLNLTVTE